MKNGIINGIINCEPGSSIKLHQISFCSFICWTLLRVLNNKNVELWSMKIWVNFQLIRWIYCSSRGFDWYRNFSEHISVVYLGIGQNMAKPMISMWMGGCISVSIGYDTLQCSNCSWMGLDHSWSTTSLRWRCPEIGVPQIIHFRLKFSIIYHHF